MEISPPILLCGRFIARILAQFFEAETGIEVHPFGGAEENRLEAFCREFVRQPDDEPPADAPAPQRFGRFPAGHVGLTIGKGIGPDGAGKRLPLPQRPDAGPAPAALGAQLRVKVIPPGRPGRKKRLCHRAGRRVPVKSDDVTGRVRTYEAIVKGHNVPQPGVPESFKVLVKELQSLCLDIQVLDKDGNVVELKEDEDAMDTFNLARMDADEDRHHSIAEDNELQESGFDIEDAPEDAGMDIGADFDDFDDE